MLISVAMKACQYLPDNAFQSTHPIHIDNCYPKSVVDVVDGLEIRHAVPTY